jgi:methyl-accepting chemotaxis protein
MPKTETVDKFFNAVTDGYEALLDAAKSANDRGYRISRQLIDEVERGQRETLDLTRKVVTAPRDVSGAYTSAVRSVTDAQGRVLDLTRQFLDELSDGQREGREVVRRVIEANRSAGQAAIEATRDAVGQAGSAVQNIRARATNGRPKAASARKTARETSTTSSSS